MSHKPNPPRDQIIGIAFWRSVRIFGLLAGAVLGTVLIVQVAQRFMAPVAEVITEDASVDLSGLLDNADQPNPPQAQFVNITASAGIDFVHQNGAFGERLLPETMGGGVAYLDYDNDGDQDLLFVSSNVWSFVDAREPFETLRLYANDGEGQFSDVTDRTGLNGLDAYGMGVAVGDYDGDGWLDVFVTAVGHNVLYHNREGVFESVTEQAGVGGEPNAWSTGATFFDANNDGWLDLYVANYVVWSRDIDIEVDYRLTGIGRAYGPPSNFQGTQPYLYINQGDGTFIDASQEAGLRIEHPTTGNGIGKGLAVIPVDIDHNGLTDLVVANDTTRNFVFLNETDPATPMRVRFREAGTELGLGFDRNGLATGAMGIDFAHYKNDDALAIAIGNFANEMSSFYVSTDQAVQFNDQSIGVGIGGPTRLALTFGVFFFDYDLDGRLDYLQTNGHVEDEIHRVQASQTHRQSAQLFWNCGDGCDRTFIAHDIDALGDLATPIVGRGAAYGDLNQDGRLDVVLTQIGGPPLVLINKTPTPHSWLGLQLKGLKPNTFAYGAKVTVRHGQTSQVKTLTPTRSYLSQMALPLHFGLGTSQQVDEVVIEWPNGEVHKLTELAINRYHVVEQSTGQLD